MAVRERIRETLKELAEITAPPVADAQPSELLEQLAPILGRRSVLLRNLEELVASSPVGLHTDTGLRDLARRVAIADRDWERALSSAREVLGQRVGAVRRMKQRDRCRHA